MSRSQSVEDYLKAIYKLDQEGENGVSNSRLAEEMGVAGASVTNMVKRLSKMGLVEYESYYGSRLTKSGEEIALEIIRHHRLLELYLKEMMGYSWDEVHDEAEKLEHHISEQFEDRIAELLNNPKYDPHGDPIPAKDGSMPQEHLFSLLEIKEETPCIIRRVKNQDPDLLRYLEERNLIPGVKIKVSRREPFDGPIHIFVEGEKGVAIGASVASDIYVVNKNG
ncbi:metal-dependent transcriptional regulator [Rhodohalobacter halophilus]|uniref:metal-dependent transcriptional regulator n=1 Tax=Rhodohalobacter halophilus TaxID=1812810 RepID=UPI00083F62A1|nr:metal-dependent transcriptional regulator [Rhodohalobacter halophilus]